MSTRRYYYLLLEIISFFTINIWLSVRNNQVFKEMKQYYQNLEERTDNREKFSHLNSGIIRYDFKIIILTICKKLKV